MGNDITELWFYWTVLENALGIALVVFCSILFVSAYYVSTMDILVLEIFIIVA